MATAETSYGDALTRPFWEAARERRLIIQRCRECGAFQFYPRPFCLGCQSDHVEWVGAKGTGVIYSVTMVRMQVVPELEPPYQVAIVELDEGPRLLAGIEGDRGRIGNLVEVRWRERQNLPPLPMFAVLAGGETVRDRTVQ